MRKTLKFFRSLSLSLSLKSSTLRDALSGRNNHAVNEAVTVDSAALGTAGEWHTVAARYTRISAGKRSGGGATD